MRQMLKEWSIFTGEKKKGQFCAIKWYKLETGLKCNLIIICGWLDLRSSGPEGTCCTCSCSHSVHNFPVSLSQNNSRAMLSLTVSPQMRLCRCSHLKAFLQVVPHTIKWDKPVWVSPHQPPLSLSFWILPPAGCNVFPWGRMLWLHGGGRAKHQTTTLCVR